MMRLRTGDRRTGMRSYSTGVRCTCAPYSGLSREARERYGALPVRATLSK